MFRRKRRLGISVLKNLLLERIFKYVTSNSTEMFLKGKESISINPQLYGYHERELSDLIIYIADCGNNDYLIDIGANIGIFSLYAAFKGHNIISIEPESLNFAVLNINIYDNQFQKNIKSFPFSISLKNNIGFLKLSEIAWGKSNHQFNHKEQNDNSYLQGSYGCSADYLFEKINFIPDYIKIDVDGNELLVIQGMENTLKSGSIKSILIEINLSDQRNKEIFKIFSKYNYNITFSKAVYESQPNIVNYIYEKN